MLRGKEGPSRTERSAILELLWKGYLHDPSEIRW